MSTVTVQKLIDQLPPYQDQWELRHPNQTVKHIMSQILEAHQEFAPYYDNISSFFDDSDTEKICNNIYFFLKDNIRYKEESEERQTTALPTGILTRLHGDCKHYAGFAAGILDALNRQGHKIKWSYVFASYKALDSSPHHVFVEVNDNGKEIWIDPTPGADNKRPAWMTRKKIKATMPLYNNISGVDDKGFVLLDDDLQMIGKRPFWQLMPTEGVRGADGNHGTNPYFTGPFLALQHYAEDPYSIEGTNWNTTADAINAAIANGPDPAHEVDGKFVQWVYDHSMKGWNFYYTMGVPEGYTPAVDLPSWYPKLILTDDFKLQLDKFYPVDDYMNNEIHALTAWAQAMILENAIVNGIEPFPITPRAIKEFSQGKNGNDLFIEDRGLSALKRLWKGFAFWNLYSMRGAYLNVVRANWFHVGKKLWLCMHNDDGTIDPEGYAKLATVWVGVFAGKMEHLVAAAENGRFKPAIDSSGNTISGNKIGISELMIAALAAAAATVIAAMGTAISSIIRAKSERDGKDYNIDPATGQTYPPVPITTGGGLDVNNIITKIKANPLPYVAGAGALYLLTRKKKVSGIGDDILTPLLIAGAVWYFFIRPKNQALTVDQMRDALFTVKDKVEEWVKYVTALTEQQVMDEYEKYFPAKTSGIGKTSFYYEQNYQGDIRTCYRGANWWDPPICGTWGANHQQ